MSRSAAGPRRTTATDELRGIPHGGVDLRERLFGLGSVFGKTLRDSRWPILVVAGIIGAMIAAGGEVMSTTYGAPGTRAELGAMSAQMPAALRGVYGNPVAVDTLGGFVSWHYASYFALIAGLWSILALSSTLAREARRGSLELAVATPRSRRSIASEKVAGHVVAMAVAMAIVAAIAWVTGAVFATMPGDEIPLGAAATFVVGIAARALLAGSIAFALASFLGRGTAAGIAGALMLGGYVVYGYRTVVPAFDSVAGLLWWSWTADHIPLAGQVDWRGVAITLALALAFVAVGVETFRRRDIGATVAIPTPRPPGSLLGLGGPVSRSLGDLLPAATWWGIGLAVYGAAMAAASRSLIDLFVSSPDLALAFRTMVPDMDLTTVGGFLQLAFADLGFLVVGLTAVTLVADRWAEESSGRLELLLATPLSRARWTLATAVSLWLAIALVTLLLAGGVAAGATATGGDPAAAGGTLVLGLYAAALAGIGVAAGGVLGPSAGALAAGVVWVGTFLLDTLAPILRLPDWVAQLALTTHLGEPYVGEWDAAGAVACIVIALAGAAVGAWGMSRRDIGR